MVKAVQFMEILTALYTTFSPVLAWKFLCP